MFWFDELTAQPGESFAWEERRNLSGTAEVNAARVKDRFRSAGKIV
jgi:hypothetical protein